MKNQFKMRAEAMRDVTEFMLNVPSPASFNIENSGIDGAVVEVKTILSEREVRDVLNAIPDSHVMLETLKPSNQYTGERISAYDQPGKRNSLIAYE